jgi:hypothetical protein
MHPIKDLIPLLIEDKRVLRGELSDFEKILRGKHVRSWGVSGGKLQSLRHMHHFHSKIFDSGAEEPSSQNEYFLIHCDGR